MRIIYWVCFANAIAVLAAGLFKVDQPPWWITALSWAGVATVALLEAQAS